MFLGVDLGTSSVKLIAVNENGDILGESVRDYPIYYPKLNYAEQNPEDWWSATKEAMKELVGKLDTSCDKIESIGLSGQMHGLVILDEDDNVLRPALLWCDQRTQKECDEITDHFGKDKLRDLTANKALTGFTAPKILWVKNNEPEIFNKISKIMLPKDYINYKLTGNFSTDVSDASGMLLVDVKNRKWSNEVLEFLSINEDMLPKLYESSQSVGTVKKELKDELDIENDIIVAAGAGDQAAGAVGIGVVESGMLSVALGTSGVVFAAHDKFAVDEDARVHSFCHANNKYHSMGVMLSAASCLKWWVEEVNKNASFDELLEEATKVEPGSNGLVFLPYLVGERTPYPDPNARGCFIGLTITHTRAHMTRAILEGVSFGLRDSLEILRELKVPIKEVRVYGGGAKSQLWRQILADIFDCNMNTINTNQGPALGGAILGCVAADESKSVEQVCGKLIKVTNTVEPIAQNVDKYNKVYKIYHELYGTLKGAFNKLSQI
ncbi:xylulokinase [Vallitalea longa]|uniref:Xylulose kinase n=1 Tax=Vallitalea longa TaxID=2936439 RepID=A0A9W5YBD2_9FIRM|nr:xylulokinase [Vallitalea longa]GKX29541.1 xylulokinase [Vallitalea longa]